MRCVLLTLGVALSALVCAQPALTFPPPKVNAPDEATLRAIKEKIAELEKLIAGIDPKNRWLPDVEIFLKAAQYIVRHNEFYGKQAQATLSVLDEGLKRAAALAKDGKPHWLGDRRDTVVFGYRSAIDGSVQPYAVTAPPATRGTEIPGAGVSVGLRAPIHVVLHGRDSGLTEISFLHRHGTAKPAPKGERHVTIHIFGRGNNAYRWAGEMDVWEAVADCLPKLRAVKELIVTADPARLVLRGFSMGGAGAWHLGLHHPDQSNVIGPGAGFTTTYGYIRGLKKLPPHQDACLKIYDAVGYAENAFNVPVVAYSGADDPQKAAADNIEAELKKLGLKMTHLVAPRTGHTIPAEYQQKLAKEYAKHTYWARNTSPKAVRFVTYTLRYPTCYWLNIQGLEKHYLRARVEADRLLPGFSLKTENVRKLSLRFDGLASRMDVPIKIDGQTIDKAPITDEGEERFIHLRKKAGKWEVWKHTEKAAEKSPGLQGPIDDAFMGPFLCVRGTGKPWNAAVHAHAAASLERFRREWSKYLRGDIRIKDDRDVTEDDIKQYHLVLFGDPGSNSLISKVMPKLPFRWTEKTVTWQGKEQDAGSHVPVLIQPNPLHATKYVVLNSGHTFHQEDFEGTNARLYPRLGDHALLKVTDPKRPLAVEVVTAGLFDEFWKFRAPEKP